MTTPPSSEPPSRDRFGDPAGLPPSGPPAERADATGGRRHDPATEEAWKKADSPSLTGPTSTSGVDAAGNTAASSGQADRDGVPRIPGVRIDAEIGQGGFASVYRGRQMSVDRDVAVKVDQRRLLDARDRRRFAREIIAAGAVSAHPNIVTLYDGGTTFDDHPYLVMELYTGGSYSDRMRSQGPVPIPQVLDVGFAIADALVAAHAEGILHRDVKPANILISRYGSPALTDFGLAALPPAGEGYSVTMESLTPSYAPPESFSGAEPTVLVDVYALGATLYAMARGKSPRADEEGNSPPIARLLALLNEPLPPLTVPGADQIMPVLWRATAIQPQNRYQSAAEFRDALAAVRAGRLNAARGLLPFGSPPPAAPPDDWTPRPPSGGPSPMGVPPAPRPLAAPPALPEKRRSRRWIAITAAVVVAAALITGVVLFVRSGGTNTGGTNSSTASSSSTTTNPPTSSVTSSSASTGSQVIPPISFTTQSPTTSETTSTSSAPSSSSPLTRTSPSTSTSTSVSLTVAPVAPKVGTCWRALSLTSGMETAAQVPSCASTHDWEAYAVGELAPTTESASYADVLNDLNVMDTCDKLGKHLSAYADPSYAGQQFSTEVLPPSASSFAKGQRGFWCLAHPPGKKNYTGSFARQQ